MPYAGSKKGRKTMSIDLKKAGLRIKSFRRHKALTREQLSSLSNSSVDLIAKVEQGERSPSLDTLIEIANALGVSADDILIDSLLHSNSMVGNEIQEILLDCNHDEKEMLIRTLKFLKALFSEFGI